jgi:hypothetical protein
MRASFQILEKRTMSASISVWRDQTPCTRSQAKILARIVLALDHVVGTAFEGPAQGALVGGGLENEAVQTFEGLFARLAAGSRFFVFGSVMMGATACMV